MMNLTWNQKHVKTLALALRPQTNLLVLEGTVRSSKTVVAIATFYYKVISSPEHLHCIAAKDYDAIQDNVLDCNGLGLTSGKYPNVIMRKGKIGGWYVAIKGLDKKWKKVLLAGYSNKDQWKKILGKTIGTFLIDECNTADKQFIEETFSRQASVDSPLSVWTLNGDDPQHYIYQDFINYCKPLLKVPASILHDMNEKENKSGRFYIHWTFEDNPVMTPEKIQRAKDLYPVGSFYYTIKILGERGQASGLIYDALVQEFDKYIVHDMSKYVINEMVIGVDFGGHHSAHTFVCTLYCNQRSVIIHAESERIDALGMTADQLSDRFETFVKKVKTKYNYHRTVEVYVDSAEQTLRNSLIFKAKRTALGVDIRNALKKPILDRIDYQLQLISLGILKFNADAKSCIEAYRTARWNDKPGHVNERLDDGTSDIDTMDASEYTLEPKMSGIQKLIEVRR